MCVAALAERRELEANKDCDSQQQYSLAVADECMDYSQCSHELQSTAPTDVSGRVCTRFCEPCVEAEFQLKLPMRSADRVCMPISPACTADEYECAYPTAMNDRKRENITACDSSIQYEVAGPTATSDRVCKFLSTCADSWDTFLADPATRVLESAHPYADDMDTYVTGVAVEGAAALQLCFHGGAATEGNCDWVTIYQDEYRSAFWGSEKNTGGRGGSAKCFPGIGDSPPLVLPAGSFVLRFRSDGSNTDWGSKLPVCVKVGDAATYAANYVANRAEPFAAGETAEGSLLALTSRCCSLCCRCSCYCGRCGCWCCCCGYYCY